MSTKVSTDFAAGKPAEMVVRSKTDQRYWLEKVERREREMAGKRLLEPDYTVVIQFSKTRRRVKLGTANKATAAQTAASFYRSLIQKGWQGAHADHPVTLPKLGESKPVEEDPGPDVATIGKLLDTYRKVAAPRASTMAAYERAIRKIYGSPSDLRLSVRFA
jgi:hypothetical protein